MPQQQRSTFFDRSSGEYDRQSDITTRCATCRSCAVRSQQLGLRDSFDAMSLRWQCMNIDSIDPIPLARWWADLLGWRITFEEADQVVLEPPEGSPEDGVSPDMLFLRVPESKQVKNRIHIDLRPDDQAAEVARAESLGARRVDVGQSSAVSWVVMADPEGNEFCILKEFSSDLTE